MSKTLVLGLVLVAFTALNVEAIATYGYVGFFEVLLSNIAGVLVMTDIVIAISLILLWMVGDARERGLPFWPYAILGLLLGSIGPLSYLIHRELKARAATRATA